MFEQQVHGAHVVLLAGDVERSEAILQSTDTRTSTPTHTHREDSVHKQQLKVLRLFDSIPDPYALASTISYSLNSGCGFQFCTIKEIYT